MRTAIQLFTLRDYGTSTADRVALAAEAGFDAVELAGLPSEADRADAIDALADHDVDVAAAHVPVETIEGDSADVAAACDALGCEHVVVPFLPPSAFESDDAVAATARRLTRLADALADRGLACSYHNHDHEFRSLPDADGTAYDRLLALTDGRLGVELDLGWAVADGVDPVRLLRGYGDRIELVHAKDAADGAPVQLGRGDVDFPAALAAARDAGVDWAIYEHDDPDDPAADARVGRTRLCDLFV